MRARDRLYRVEGLILKRVDMGEADRLLTLLTPDRGKLRVVAKGARKPSSRKSGHVELFNRVALLVAKGREIDIVTQADTLDSYQPLRRDLTRLSYGYYLAELLDRFVEEGSDNPALYNFAAQALGWLAVTADPPRTMRFIELHLLAQVGYRPELYRCIHCGRELAPEQNLFSVEGGGMLDPRCAVTHRDAIPLTLNALKVLRYLQTREYASIQDLRLGAPVQQEVETLLQRFIVFHLERNLKSVEFLKLLAASPSAPL